MQLYSFRNVADAIFLLVALALAVSSFLLITSTLVDHLRNYRYPALQVRQCQNLRASVRFDCYFGVQRGQMTRGTFCADMLHADSAPCSHLRAGLLVHDGVPAHLFLHRDLPGHL